MRKSLVPGNFRAWRWVGLCFVYVALYVFACIEYTLALLDVDAAILCLTTAAGHTHSAQVVCDVRATATHDEHPHATDT